MDRSFNERVAYIYGETGREKTAVFPPEEFSFRILVNGDTLVTLLCTPQKLDFLAAGHLYNDGYIDSADEITAIDVDTGKKEIRVTAPGLSGIEPRKRIYTSGFGGGVISDDEMPVKNSAPSGTLSRETIIRLMEEMKGSGLLYKRSGGIHSSALCTNEGVVFHAEDIGRHNTMDKICGEYLLSKRRDRPDIMMTTGRMSSEMVIKAVKMGIFAVASLTTPTLRAVDSARRCGLTLIGYVGEKSVTVYSAFENVVL
ncbi:MAG: formate dehydrogenase accessory sulfurtransferase FdhD [Oscillospiraceae bacterium]|nr:formate dehydrogenase accessory sulfurtransferase FdhD [Oscillospiraceae bacterium]